MNKQDYYLKILRTVFMRENVLRFLSQQDNLVNSEQQVKHLEKIRNCPLNMLLIQKNSAEFFSSKLGITLTYKSIYY